MVTHELSWQSHLTTPWTHITIAYEKAPKENKNYSSIRCHVWHRHRGGGPMTCFRLDRTAGRYQEHLVWTIRLLNIYSTIAVQYHWSLHWLPTLQSQHRIGRYGWPISDSNAPKSNVAVLQAHAESYHSCSRCHIRYWPETMIHVILMYIMRIHWFWYLLWRVTSRFCLHLNASMRCII